MAPAILASRNDPSSFSVQCGVVFMRKHANPTVSSNYNNNKNPPFLPNPNPNPNLNPIHHHRIKQFEDSSSDGAYVTFHLASYTRNQLRELKNHLISELERVRILKERIELETRPVCDPPEPKTTDGAAKKQKVANLKRVNPFSGEKQPDPKRLLAAAAADPVVASMLRRCEQILGKLMKHKWSWVFNTPVDVVGLGLHDYYQIIKKPMDLGTIKANLDKGLYESPLDFASDVRLTFTNAMTYNPKGQDVYRMAEQLLGKFEEMFNPAYKKFEAEKLKIVGSVAGTSSKVEKERSSSKKPAVEKVRRGPEPILIAKKLETVKPLPPPPALPPQPSPPAPPPPLPPVTKVEALPDVLEAVKAKKGKLPKPKAKDPNKRPMTMEEKAKLGMNLQELPPEKLGQMVHILRKRNGHMAQDGDEIELDIEAIDNETLWELDRFVTNYKKMVSKIKRQGFIQNQITTPPHLNKALVSEMGSAERKGKKGDTGEEDVDIGEDIPMANYPSVEIERDATAAASSGSSSSSSSSSSGSSSSSDSDSGSSSGSDSDADSVQSPFVEPKEAPAG